MAFMVLFTLESGMTFTCMKPKEINELIAHHTQGQSDAYRLGFSRGHRKPSNIIIFNQKNL